MVFVEYAKKKDAKNVANEYWYSIGITMSVCFYLRKRLSMIYLLLPTPHHATESLTDTLNKSCLTLRLWATRDTPNFIIQEISEFAI